MHNDIDTSILDEITSQQGKEWVGDGGDRRCNRESIQQLVSLWYAVEPSPWVSVDVIFLSSIVHQIVRFSTKLSHTCIKNYCFEW